MSLVAHALVMPSDDPEEKRNYHRETERLATHKAIAPEQSLGATVRDVSTPPPALEARCICRSGREQTGQRILLSDRMSTDRQPCPCINLSFVA